MANSRDDQFLTYQFLARVSTPFNQWDAFRLKIIDGQGKVLRPRETLKTQQEKNAWGQFDIICCNLKKIIAKYPSLSSQSAMIRNTKWSLKNQQPGFSAIPIQAVGAAYFLMKEGLPTYDDENLLTEKVNYYTKIIENEGVAVNNVGGGQIASVGVGDQGEPPGIPCKKKKSKTQKIRRIINAIKI